MFIESYNTAKSPIRSLEDADIYGTLTTYTLKVLRKTLYGIISRLSMTLEAEQLNTHRTMSNSPLLGQEKYASKLKAATSKPTRGQLPTQPNGYLKDAFQSFIVIFDSYSRYVDYAGEFHLLCSTMWCLR